jgi:hypothetical protein
MVMRARLVLAVLLCATTAHAEDPRAQTLYDEAKTHVAAGQWNEACPKLAESQKLAPKMNTVYRLAECYEHIGLRASAWKRYREAAIAATTAGETGKAKAALERAEKLAPTLAKLSVKAPPDANVRIDGIALTESEVSTPFAIDPGDHPVEVTAPKKKTFNTSVTIPNDNTTTSLVIPALADDTTGEPVTPATPKPSAPETTSNPSRTIGMVLAGTGVVAIGIGGFLALSARSKYHDADPHCPIEGCNEVGKQMTDDARSLGNVATVVIGAGLAIGITGAVLWLTAPSVSTSRGSTPRVGLTVLPGGLSLRGEF